MPKAWICEICDKPVSEVGAYVKRTVSQYAHAHCFAKKEYDLGWERGRAMLRQEQHQAALERAEHERRVQEEQQARERAEQERRLEIQERERTNRIIAQQNMPLPPKLEVKKPDAPKEEAPKPDRFQIIDLD